MRRKCCNKGSRFGRREEKRFLRDILVDDGDGEMNRFSIRLGLWEMDYRDRVYVGILRLCLYFYY